MAYESVSAPAPPYSSGTVMPIKPSSASWAMSSYGKRCSRSSSAAMGADVRVLQIGVIRVDEAPVAGMKRPGPGVVAAGLAGFDHERSPLGVVREHAGVKVAERAFHRPGESREVDEVRGAKLPGVG